MHLKRSIFDRLNRPAPQNKRIDEQRKTERKGLSTITFRCHIKVGRACGSSNIPASSHLCTPNYHEGQSPP